MQNLESRLQKRLSLKQRITAGIIGGAMLLTSWGFMVPGVKAQETERPKNPTSIIYMVPSQEAIDAYIKSLSMKTVKDWCNAKKENANEFYSVLQEVGYSGICRQQFKDWTDGRMENGELISMSVKYKGTDDYLATLWYSTDYAVKIGDWGGVESTGYITAPPGAKGKGVRMDAIKADKFFGLLTRIKEWKEKKPKAQPTRVTPTPLDIDTETPSEKYTPKATPEPSPSRQSPETTPTPYETGAPKPTPCETDSPKPIPTPFKTKKSKPIPTPFETKTLRTTPTPHETAAPKAMPEAKETPSAQRTETKITEYIPEVRAFIGDPRKKIQGIYGNKVVLTADEKGIVNTYLCIMVRDTKDDKNTLDLLVSEPSNNYIRRWGAKFEIEYTPKQLAEILSKESSGKISYEQFKDAAALGPVDNEENLVYRFAIVKLNTKLDTQKRKTTTPRQPILWAIPQRPDIKYKEEQMPKIINIGAAVFDNENPRHVVTMPANFNYRSITDSLELICQPQLTEVILPAHQMDLGPLFTIASYLLLKNDINALAGTRVIHAGAGYSGSGGWSSYPGPGSGP